MSSSPSSCSNGYPELNLKVTAPAGSTGTIYFVGQSWDLATESGAIKTACPSTYLKSPAGGTVGPAHSWHYGSFTLVRAAGVKTTNNGATYSSLKVREIKLWNPWNSVSYTDQQSSYKTINGSWQSVASHCYCYLDVFCGPGNTTKNNYTLSSRMLGTGEDLVTYTDDNNITYSWWRGNGDWDAIVN